LKWITCSLVVRHKVLFRSLALSAWLPPAWSDSSWCAGAACRSLC